MSQYRNISISFFWRKAYRADDPVCSMEEVGNIFEKKERGKISMTFFFTH
jgi:hypothetical protein